jgi:hypothetical protein
MTRTVVVVTVPLAGLEDAQANDLWKIAERYGFAWSEPTVDDAVVAPVMRGDHPAVAEVKGVAPGARVLDVTGEWTFVRTAAPPKHDAQGAAFTYEMRDGERVVAVLRRALIDQRLLCEVAGYSTAEVAG